MEVFVLLERLIFFLKNGGVDVVVNVFGFGFGGDENMFIIWG